MKLSLSTSLSGFTKSAVPFVGVLDGFQAGLKVAWSIKKRLLASYTGYAALVRADRTGQPTYQIPFLANGDWDTAGLLSFAGSDSVYLVTMYSHIGSFDFTQATAASQPRIVNAGALDTNGFVLAPGKTLNCTLSASDFTGSSGTTVQVVSGLRFSVGGALWSYGPLQDTGCYLNAFGGVYSDLPNPGSRIVAAETTTGVDHVISQERSGADHFLRIDGSIVASTNSAINSINGTAQTLNLNAYFGDGVTGNMQTFCIWDNTTNAAGRAAALA